MPYLYQSNNSSSDRFEQVTISRDNGTPLVLQKGLAYVLSATELARARQYVVMVDTDALPQPDPDPGGGGGGGSTEWKGHVDDVADLPASNNDEGDVRLVLNDIALYAWDGADWQPLSGGGGAPFAIAGDPEVGATLVASNVPGDASLAWFRDAVQISGANDTSYTIRAVDQGHDITCRATDPSNAIVVPPGAGTGLAFRGAGRVAWDASGINLSDTAHSLWALWEPVGPNGVSWTLLGGESAVGKAHWIWYRMGGGSFWVPDSLGFYRYRLPPDDNEDLVWTTLNPGSGSTPGITATLADGLLSSFVGKPLLGGAGNELYASQYKRSGGAWVHDTNSPGRFNFQIALGSPLGAGGKIIAGVANGNDYLNANLHGLAIFEDLITDWDAVMAAKSTHAILQQGPVWCTDSSVNLEVNLVGNGSGDMIESEGVDQADPPDSAVWLAGP